MTEQSSNTRIWDQASKTDPNFTKSFSRGGGFKGTATNATWLAKKATEIFGPAGTGWGMEVIRERIVEGHIIDVVGGFPVHHKVHIVHARLWYIDPATGEKCVGLEQFGQTDFVLKDSRGVHTDEEAPKKSLTDAMSKAMSHLGFAADIHMGLYDDNKYVSELRKEFGDTKADMKREATRPARAKGEVLTVEQHIAAMKSTLLPADLKQAFGKAWKQHEKPGDPHAQTPAQTKLKAAYDIHKQIIEIANGVPEEIEKAYAVFEAERNPPRATTKGDEEG